MQVRDLNIDEIQIGSFACYETLLGTKEVSRFAELTGDVSPLHVDVEYGQSTPFGTNLVHGMLAASHFSTLVGVLLPGRRALLSSIHLEFLQPIPVGSTVTISGKVIGVSRIVSAITLDVVVLLKHEACITGKVTVTVRS